MPSFKTLSGATAAIALAVVVASPATSADPSYPFLDKAVPIDLDPGYPEGGIPADDISDDGTPVLTAHITIPEREDEACRAAANQSNGGNAGTIVACSHGGSGTSQRVPPAKSIDENTRNGTLHPPDVSGLPGCLGPCITIRFGRVPPPVYYIDLSAIPEPPEGSDAWKISKGLLRAP
ncbi:hypothetical protein [Novosphingobium album (ex Hu et al. 2023)]|uniref:Secreted protein n=1 Tax=Novosphingobium album (ex Hu et al. 2023) TaxID=2930093 RepID=A0ABT0B652_9SPHN|nr:hypothetical protein [Novosphingobium album (ex Hu et al. 2023)]MCJ2180333.1 hypothetical protein [Novosphingobium album (ex Hu et al. 2023)]